MEKVEFPVEIPEVNEVIQFSFGGRVHEARVRYRWRSKNERSYFIQLDLDDKIVLWITPDASERGILDRAGNLKPYWRVIEITEEESKVSLIRLKD